MHLYRIVGLDGEGNKAFDYHYDELDFYGTAWNAAITQWENLQLKQARRWEDPPEKRRLCFVWGSNGVLLYVRNKTDTSSVSF